MDVSLFGVDANGKLSDDRYFIFYNQKRSPEGALESLGGNMLEREGFRLDLDQLPATIDRLILTVSLDGTGSMSGLEQRVCTPECLRPRGDALRVFGGVISRAKKPSSSQRFTAKVSGAFQRLDKVSTVV